MDVFLQMVLLPLAATHHLNNFSSENCSCFSLCSLQDQTHFNSTCKICVKCLHHYLSLHFLPAHPCTWPEIVPSFPNECQLLQIIKQEDRGSSFSFMSSYFFNLAHLFYGLFNLFISYSAIKKPLLHLIRS